MIALLGAMQGWRCLPGEARRTPSPNSGWPMAAMALALGVRLRKPGIYELGGGREAAPRDLLRAWKLRQIQALQAMGWLVQPSETNFFMVSCADPSSSKAVCDLQTLLCVLRERGIKLRDGASFGLAGRMRLAVVAG